MKKLLIDNINMLLSKTSESSQSRKYKMLTDLKKDIRNNKPYTLPKYLEKEVAKKIFDKYQNIPNSFSKQKKKLRADLNKLNFVPTKKVNYKIGKYDTYLNLKEINGNKNLTIGISRKYAKDKNMLNQIAYELITKASGNYQDRYSPEFQDLNPENLDYIMEVLYND
jgi:hypothetical protein